MSFDELWIRCRIALFWKSRGYQRADQVWNQFDRCQKNLEVTENLKQWKLGWWKMCMIGKCSGGEDGWNTVTSVTFVNEICTRFEEIENRTVTSWLIVFCITLLWTSCKALVKQASMAPGSWYSWCWQFCPSPSYSCRKSHSPNEDFSSFHLKTYLANG